MRWAAQLLARYVYNSGRDSLRVFAWISRLLSMITPLNLAYFGSLRSLFDLYRYLVFHVRLLVIAISRYVGSLCRRFSQRFVCIVLYSAILLRVRFLRIVCLYFSVTSVRLAYFNHVSSVRTPVVLSGSDSQSVSPLSPCNLSVRFYSSPYWVSAYANARSFLYAVRILCRMDNVPYA